MRGICSRAMFIMSHDEIQGRDLVMQLGGNQVEETVIGHSKGVKEEGIIQKVISWHQSGVTLFQVSQSLGMPENTSRKMDTCCVKEQQLVECFLCEGGNLQVLGDGPFTSEG